MKQTVKVVYILVLVALLLLIFIGHARLKVPDVVRSLDYVCDTLIPLSTIMGGDVFSHSGAKVTAYECGNHGVLSGCQYFLLSFPYLLRRAFCRYGFYVAYLNHVCFV